MEIFSKMIACCIYPVGGLLYWLLVHCRSTARRVSAPTQSLSASQEEFLISQGHASIIEIAHILWTDAFPRIFRSFWSPASLVVSSRIVREDVTAEDGVRPDPAVQLRPEQLHHLQPPTQPPALQSHRPRRAGLQTHCFNRVNCFFLQTLWKTPCSKPPPRVKINWYTFFIQIN